jgi:hypothetical protein
MTFIVETWTGYNPEPFWVDTITVIGFLIALIISTYVNLIANPN